LTQSQIDPPVTANRAERRSSTRKRRVPLALILVPIVLVVAAAALILTLGGGGDGVLGIVGGDDASDEVPAFDFRLGNTAVVPVVAGTDTDTLKAEARTVSEQVAAVVDDLYTNAFLDPTNWREGDYEEIVDLFADEARASAEQGVETLTLGASAGDVYASVAPERGGLTFSVLFDREGAPHTVVVEVRFTALGERQDGTYTAIVSDGTFFLRDLDGWRVTAFDIERADREARAPAPAPSSTASPS
jgi:hypothetical protein